MDGLDSEADAVGLPSQDCMRSCLAAATLSLTEFTAGKEESEFVPLLLPVEDARLENHATKSS